MASRWKKPQLVVPKRRPAPPIKIAPLQRALEAAVAPAEIKEIAAQLDAFESYMHDCGLYSIEDMRPINEARMRARWKLGRALKMVERQPEGGDRTPVRRLPVVFGNGRKTCSVFQSRSLLRRSVSARCLRTS